MRGLSGFGVIESGWGIIIDVSAARESVPDIVTFCFAALTLRESVTGIVYVLSFAKLPGTSIIFSGKNSVIAGNSLLSGKI
jgi:hypothetical protein